MNMEHEIQLARRVLGRNVAAAQQRANLTDQQLAAACGLSANELAAIKAAQADVPLDTLSNLARALRVPLSKLLES